MAELYDILPGPDLFVKQINIDGKGLHDKLAPLLMSYPGAEIFKLSDKGIKKIEYKDTEHYRITKGFIDKPEVMFRHLFASN